MAEAGRGDHVVVDDFDFSPLFVPEPRPPLPPLVFTLTIRVGCYVYKLDDGSDQVVDKHDVVFDFNISGMSWVSFSEAVAHHIKMGIGQEVRLFALDTTKSTIDLVLNGQQLMTHFVGNHWDFEAKKSFLLAEVVTLEAPNAKKVGKKRAPKQPAAPNSRVLRKSQLLPNTRMLQKRQLPPNSELL
ncbi:hypothetical protein D1007_24488 [Hordeum vulgare]|nr:hypothetical protein D1007_24488 [Hordeum vulgare]